MAFLADVVDAFLRRHNFLHAHVRGHTHAIRPEPSSPNKKRRIIPDDHSEYYTQEETPDKLVLVASPVCLLVLQPVSCVELTRAVEQR
jgi:hypothetical protein